jgi:hypothetical protein
VNSLLPLTGDFFLRVHYISQMSNYTNYASFNALTVTGRVSDLKILKGQYGESLVVTMITTLETDGEEANVVFTNKNGLMTMFKNGKLDTGRTLTVTGHISKIEQVYTDKGGAVRMLKRPRVSLKQAQVLDGGLGPAPKKEVAPSTAGQLVEMNQPKVDETPELTPEEAYATEY